jgi:hypothetical protein
LLEKQAAGATIAHGLCRAFSGGDRRGS